MITLAEPDWTIEDAAVLRDFLATPTGRRFVESMVFNRPSFEFSNVPMEQSFARSRDIAGYEAAIAQIVALTNPMAKVQEVKDPPPMYPDLEDDTKWPVI